MQIFAGTLEKFENQLLKLIIIIINYYLYSAKYICI